MLATSLTIASGASGGVFTPSLYIGAMLGGVYGMIVHELFPGMTSSYGAYALVGMAAVFSGASRASLTAVVILFEMTLEYSIILPLMFSCVIANQVASILYGEKTLYSVKLMRKGISSLIGFGANVYETTLVKEIMSIHVKSIYEDFTLEEAETFMKDSVSLT